MCEVCRPAPGLRRWASHTSSGMLWCVMRSADLLLGCVGGSLSLSVALSYFVVVCVGSADLLMGYVGGSLTHLSYFVFDVCGVYRPAPGLRRWASHASS